MLRNVRLVPANAFANFLHAPLAFCKLLQYLQPCGLAHRKEHAGSLFISHMHICAYKYINVCSPAPQKEKRKEEHAASKSAHTRHRRKKEACAAARARKNKRRRRQRPRIQEKRKKGGFSQIPPLFPLRASWQPQMQRRVPLQFPCSPRLASPPRSCLFLSRRAQ